ncbi:peptidase M84 [Paenibacillus sp. 19GGS1-52]|uniref:M12 family metallo-peptidase n=1 Tax=Paenibacillus sp. 19GGS1-52 TaxID=2758563 RepID=UPI001EFBF261|nr:M12 family metallo-peptidase [Paenibacillus sp. 19GGS1-52]ULO09591.1 peptidase M84 [Paenibacillus sp. 19GGS1-52]
MATSGFASVEGANSTFNADEVKIFYQKYATQSEGSPIETSPQLKLFTSTPTPKIERSSVAPIFDESGKIVSTVNIGKNVVGTKSINLDSASAAATGKICSVLVAVDEEYRAKHSDWQTLTTNIVEAADDAFNSNFGVDLSVTAYRYWFSSGSNSAEILDNLKGSGTDGYDFVTGFTAEPDFFTNGVQIGGKAYTYSSAPLYAAYSAVWDQASYGSNWHALQHELSHNYSLEHDLPEGPTPVCIMNYGTMYQTTAWHTDHRTQLAAHVSWYGNNIN